MSASKPKKLTRTQQHSKLLRDNKHLYDQLLKEQNNGCGICHRPPSKERKLAMDHDHRTMTIRGLLCFNCNRAIKSYMTWQWFKDAMAYMDKYNIEVKGEKQ